MTCRNGRSVSRNVRVTSKETLLHANPAMRPDSAVRLVFGAASTVRRVARTQPETVGAAFRHVTAAIEAASRRVSTHHLFVYLCSSYVLPYRLWQRSEPSVFRLGSSIPNTCFVCVFFTCACIMTQAGHSHPPRLIAVTKGRSVDLVQEAYSHGARHFGENYVSLYFTV